MANLLQSRHTRVTIVTEAGQEEVCREEIEEMLVDRLITLHSAYCMQ